MSEISFTDFRGFKNQSFVKIKPLTVLVGENSAGKSSFLAGLKYIIDLLNINSEPSFNSDPFQLGTFQQIAHFRGGRGGRARDFRIRLRSQVDMSKFSVSDLNGRQSFDLSATFTNADSQASISTLRFSSGSKALELAVTSDGVKLDYVGTRNSRTSLTKESTFPLTIVDLPRIWSYVFQDLSFRFSPHGNLSDDTEISERIKTSIFELASIASAAGSSFRQMTQATSAIRTKPSRTYTPGAEVQDGEGTHVPYEIAKLYRSRSKNKDEWQYFKSAIEDFGTSSGMFKEISVKSFGSTTSDPFQIQFSSDGPKTNIVDLGYGTSQVLPILYDITRSPKRSRFLIQQPEVHLHPKAQAALGQYFVDAYKTSGKTFVIETHSDFIVDRIRNGVAEGKISLDDISILFFKRSKLENRVVPIELDERGDPVNPPDDYRSFFVDEQMKMLGL
ncbi:AAA family ATPase [Roseovarius aestuariivivens]|uniref:AAA family ATPase n=1 Tax=Roseovarius aestuariivivens TaxID=1888910 RepID=UPI001080E604|nr:AAA family ATPase [Roseovarius aestuariivivens]